MDREQRIVSAIDGLEVVLRIHKVGEINYSRLNMTLDAIEFLGERAMHGFPPPGWMHPYLEKPTYPLVVKDIDGLLLFLAEATGASELYVTKKSALVVLNLLGD